MTGQHPRDFLAPCTIDQLVHTRHHAAVIFAFGNIEVGEGAKIGSCSVVLQAVPPHTTVAGVPAKIVGKPKTDKPSLDMDQGFNGRSQNFIHGDGI